MTEARTVDPARLLDFAAAVYAAVGMPEAADRADTGLAAMEQEAAESGPRVRRFLPAHPAA